MNTKLKPADFIISSMFLAVSIVFLLSWTINPAKGSIAEVNAGGKVYEYPLNQDRIVRISSGKKGRAVLEIKGGKIRFLESNCPRGICKEFGFISRPGEASICIPNKIVITIKGRKQESSVDTICR